MSNFFDRPLAPSPVSASEREAPNVIRVAGREQVPRFFSNIGRDLVLRTGSLADLAKGASQWIEALLKHLAPGERFLVRIPFSCDDDPAVTVAIHGTTQEALDRRKVEMDLAIDTALGAGLAGVRIVAVPGDAPTKSRAPHVYEIRPEGQKVDEESFTNLGLRAVPGSDDEDTLEPKEAFGVYVAQDLARRPDLAALAHLMAFPAFNGVTLTLEVARFKRDARLERVLRRTYQPLADALNRQSLPELVSKDGFRHAFFTHLAWLNAGACQRITVEVEAPKPLAPVLLEMVSQAVYGVPLAEAAPAGYFDLTRAWPDCNLAWLERFPHLLAMRRDIANREKVKARPASGVRLGRLEDGAPIYLASEVRPQHVFVLGQPGTGKSTHIANLIAQDMEAGEAIVVFDSHGDLAKEVIRQAPAHRRDDVVYIHPTDPKGKFTLNVFEPLGDEPAVEHNRVADDLINLFKRVYPEPKEAYGPMFMTYARNAIFLLLSALGSEATILQISKVFTSDRFRRELVQKCTREDVSEFWQDIAEQVRDAGENPSISTVAPYIVAKLTQLSGNEILRPIIGATKTSLDFREIVAKKRICVINLDLPGIGDEAARILGGLLFSRMSGYLKVQAKLAPGDRIPLRAYLDEVQTYADESLAQSMAQMRKFGMSYTLASQHFAALDGTGWRPDVGRSILGSASNLILFRLGYLDAQMLAPYMAPTLGAGDLIRLPNFHAAVRLLSAEGETIDPLVIKGDPPRGCERAMPPQEPDAAS